VTPYSPRLRQPYTVRKMIEGPGTMKKKEQKKVHDRTFLLKVTAKAFIEA
jgi:hypothetical protein